MTYLEEHYSEIFKKYSVEELVKDCIAFQNGNGRLYKVLNHFFEEEIFKCCGKKSSLSPWCALQDEDIMNKILDYIKSKPKFFTSDNEIANVKSAFRNSFSWCRKVANFPIKEARNIYFRYNKNQEYKMNILDTSCGFGSRMSAVLLSGHNYYGFDPNESLFNKLIECYKFYNDNKLIDSNCTLFCEGSEVYESELENKIDVCFTSPPYFNLEKYSQDGGASTANYGNYAKWVGKFVEPTVNNIYRYLKPGGYAMINIKNISKKECCFDSFFNAFNSIEGFEFVEVFDMKINKKQYGMQHDLHDKGDIKNTEPVMSFRKNNS